MTALPVKGDLDGSTPGHDEGMFQAAVGGLRDFLADLLAATGTKDDALVALRVFGMDGIHNLSVVPTVGSNALTMNIKTRAGAAPAAADPVMISQRNAVAGSGDFLFRKMTAAVALTVSSGSTLGTANNDQSFLYYYLIDNVGTQELAVSKQFMGSTGIVSTTAEGGAGAADSGTVMYSGTARSNVPFRCIGRMKAPQSTAGLWTALPTSLELSPFTQNEVAGNLTVTSGVLSVPDGAVGAPSVKIGDEQNGFYSIAANQLAITLNGTRIATLDPNYVSLTALNNILLGWGGSPSSSYLIVCRANSAAGNGGTQFTSTDAAPLVSNTGFAGYSGLLIAPDRWGNASTVDDHRVVYLAGSQRNAAAVCTSHVFANWGYFTGTGSGAGGLQNATARADAIKFKLEHFDGGAEFTQSLALFCKSATGVATESLRFNSSGAITTGSVAGASAAGYTAAGDITMPTTGAIRAKNTSKAWVSYNQITPAILSSFNVSSVTDVGTGDMTVNLTNAAASENELCPVSSSKVSDDDTGEGLTRLVRTTSASAFKVINCSAAGTKTDCIFTFAHAMGV